VHAVHDNHRIRAFLGSALSPASRLSRCMQCMTIIGCQVSCGDVLPCRRLWLCMDFLTYGPFMGMGGMWPKPAFCNWQLVSCMRYVGG
jgi:hypothetical protein